MASIRKEILIEASAENVWEVIGDFAAGPSRMAPGFVLDTQVEADCRIVTFADGTVVQERRVCVDHDTRRIVYTVVGGTVQPEHDNASMQVLADGERQCLLIWIRDVLPTSWRRRWPRLCRTVWVSSSGPLMVPPIRGRDRACDVSAAASVPGATGHTGRKRSSQDRQAHIPQYLIK
jgi:hypothetical protein